MIQVFTVPVLSDNYCYIITNEEGKCAVLDPGEAWPVIDKLEDLQISPDYIFITHHHPDHVGGLKQLKDRYKCKVVGSKATKQLVPDIDAIVDERDGFMLGSDDIVVFDTPGHCKDHICFYFPESHVLFSGDVIFSMGCGRLLDGTAEELWKSLQKLRKLPPKTEIYCGHEYTQTNGRFCAAIEPGNSDIKSRNNEVKLLRRENKPTIPTTMAQERKTNVFLRADDPAIVFETGLEGFSPLEMFIHLRRQRDNY